MPEITLLESSILNSNPGYLFLKDWMEWCGTKDLGTEVGVWGKQSVEVFSRNIQRDRVGQQIPRPARK